MRILLPTLHVRRSAQAVALAAGNLKAALPAEQQLQTELLDLYLEQPLDTQLQQILASQPELVAFPLYVWNRQPVLQLCRELRRQRPDLTLLAGGPEASADPATVLQQGALDGVLCGEGEIAFAQLVVAKVRGEEPTGIDGYFAPGSSERPTAASCPDLAKLPSPWLSGVLPLEPSCGVLWEIARGCTFNCAFCFDAKGEKGVRPFPWQRLQQELQLFVAQQVGQVWILDSTFNAPPERGKQLLQLLIEQAPQIHFHLEAKADFLDRATAELLAQLSCSVQIGLQSADPEVLKPLHRTLQPKKMEKALQQLADAGVTFGLDLIYGLPDDNHQGFCASLDFALQQQPNQVDIFPLAVLPGTELHQKRDKYGIDADSEPPYLIRTNRHYSAADLERSKQLALATDIFYNRGRAVGFFLQFCEALSKKPAQLLENFAAWLENRRELKSAAENWQPAEILPLQLSFIREQLKQQNKSKLLPLAEDLLNYHFCCAELLLAPDCAPPAKMPGDRQLLRQRWQLNRAVRVQKFNYVLEELAAVGGEKMAWQLKQLTCEPSYGIFLQQQGQTIIETLDDDFAQLLLAADGQRSTAELVRNLDRQSALELLQFAISQGLLLPAT